MEAKKYKYDCSKYDYSEQKHEWYMKNREKLNARSKEYYLKNRKKMLEYLKKYREEHPYVPRPKKRVNSEKLNEFGAYLKGEFEKSIIKKKLEMSQKGLAQMLETDATTFSRYLKGERRPKSETLIRYSNFLNTSFKTLQQKSNECVYYIQ